MSDQMPASPWSSAAREHDCVVFDPCGRDAGDHDAVAKASIAAALARVLGIEFAGTFEAPPPGLGRAYVVPAETLDPSGAARWRIASARNLFGGVAPHPFVGSKVITHPLARPDATAPTGWNPRFAKRVAKVVLEGCSVFTHEDARRAGARMLRGGSLRTKDAGGAGGAGQTVVRDLQALNQVLASWSAEHLRRNGLVLERNLQRVHTHSVGLLQVGDGVAAYAGHQRLTTNHRGHKVYGGSSLRVVRGGFDALLRHDLPDAVRIAVEQALAYHREAMAAYPGLFASRSNYDVAQGFDDAGAWHSGVLEQSWRVGGASGAEIAALQVLRDEPSIHWVDASTHETYASDAPVPAHARIHFDGSDRGMGRLIKFATVDAMGLLEDRVEIAVDDHAIAGTIITPGTLVPGVLFIHGWGGSQEQYLTRAREITALGCVSLTFNLRGHVETRPLYETVSREINLRDVLAAYDLLSSRRHVDPNAIAVVGSSYGGYLGSILTSMRPVKWLALRAPALYIDTGWATPKLQLHQDQDLKAYRRSLVSANGNKALSACQAFAGDVLLIESENDDVIPQTVLSSYREACTHARSLTYRCLAGADHGLTTEANQRAYNALLLGWLNEMLFGARGADADAKARAAAAQPAALPETPPQTI